MKREVKTTETKVEVVEFKNEKSSCSLHYTNGKLEDSFLLFAHGDQIRMRGVYTLAQYEYLYEVLAEAILEIKTREREQDEFN